MTAPNVIDCNALDHAFGTGEARAQVLFGVNLAIAQGEFVVLKGASGSGKTTLLTLLACLREIQGGAVEVLGNRLDGARAKRLVEVRRRLGFIFQSHNLHPALSALQNVRMGLELHGSPAMGNWQQAATHMLTCLGLGERLDYLPAKLSGGQTQRVAITRALVGNPEIVFADEPTAALDSESGRKVVDILKELGRRRGTTSLVITHDPRVLDRADRVVTLVGGRITNESRRP